MKRAIILFFILTFLLSFASCTSVTENKDEEEKEQPDITITEEEVSTITEELQKKPHTKASVFWYDFSDSYLSTVRKALNSELDALGVEYTDYDAAKSQIEQISQINDAITKGTDVLIVNIVDTASSDIQQCIVNIAKKVNKPIIFFNREVYDEVVNSYDNACFVGTRLGEASETQGIMAGKYIVENYDKVDLNGDGYISYIMMNGELGGSEGYDMRRKLPIKFCNTELTAAGKPELIYYGPNNTDLFQPSNWSKTEAFNMMEYALSAFSMDSENPIEAVFANCDDEALGCVEALNAIGWNTGEPDSPSIPVFGIDYTADAQAAIEAGKMTGSILQSATGMAKTIADLVENVMNGDHVFANTENFNVDDYANKIRVPYEIKMKEDN